MPFAYGLHSIRVRVPFERSQSDRFTTSNTMKFNDSVLFPAPTSAYTKMMLNDTEVAYHVVHDESRFHDNVELSDGIDVHCTREKLIDGCISGHVKRQLVDGRYVVNFLVVNYATGRFTDSVYVILPETALKLVATTVLKTVKASL